MKDKALHSEIELEHSIQSMAKMYSIRDREAVEPLYDPETREDLVESTISMIRKIEREVAEYLARKYGYLASSQEETAPRQETQDRALAEQAA